MLKLTRFPRAANRNRTLRQRPTEGGVDEDAARELERVFRRFWRERAAAAANRWVTEGLGGTT